HTTPEPAGGLDHAGCDVIASREDGSRRLAAFEDAAPSLETELVTRLRAPGDRPRAKAPSFHDVGVRVVPACVPGPARVADEPDGGMAEPCQVLDRLFGAVGVVEKDPLGDGCDVADQVVGEDGVGDPRVVHALEQVRVIHAAEDYAVDDPLG